MLTIQLKLDNTNLNSKIHKALEILEKYKNWNDKYVLFSGGKDSLVCLDLAYKAWKDNFKVIYIEITGNTHPKCNKYVHKVTSEYGLELIHLKYDRDFFDILKKYGYPSFMSERARWCLNRFKDRPMSEFSRNNTVNLTVGGIKQGDSYKRKKWISKHAINGVVFSVQKRYYGRVQVYPVYDWNNEDIWNYIIENNLPLNPLYNKIGGAGNCVICPAMRKDEFIAIMQKCPELFCKWKKAHEKLRRDFAEGKLRGMKIVFHRFNKWYELYCKTIAKIEHCYLF